MLFPLNKYFIIHTFQAKKNAAEQNGMRKAHIFDGAAMCDALSLLERRVMYN